MNNVNAFNIFPTHVYCTEKLDFLNIVNIISDTNLNEIKKNKKIDDVYPFFMSQNFFSDPRLFEFCKFITDTSLDILDEQGYYTENIETKVTEMWTQEHHKTSGMDYHTHGYGTLFVGFYFLDVPENSSSVIFHDPRPGKVQINLFEKNTQTYSAASLGAVFEPKPGLMLFSNSWLPHSFSRHSSNIPMKFVHFSVSIEHKSVVEMPVEIV